ncbi:MAG: hypothetical protein QM760_19285 [Nibricoccus sp.]
MIVGSLEARGTRSVIPVAGTSDEPGELDTRTTVTYTPVLAGGTYVINPILQLVKEGPRHADLCDPIEVRYVVANTGTGTETDVRIEEPLPEGLTTMDGQRVVRLSVGDLPDDAGPGVPGEAAGDADRRVHQPGERTGAPAPPPSRST